MDNTTERRPETYESNIYLCPRCDEYAQFESLVTIEYIRLEMKCSCHKSIHYLSSDGLDYSKISYEDRYRQLKAEVVADWKGCVESL